MNPIPYNAPAGTATTQVSPSQFNPPQIQVHPQEAVPVVRPGATTQPHQLNQPVVGVAPTSRPPPRIRSASTLAPAVRPGPIGWRGSGAARAGLSRVSPYNTTNAALAAKQAAEARRAREFDPDYLVYPIPTKSPSIPPTVLPPAPAPPPPPTVHVNHHQNGPNNHNPAGSTPAASAPAATLVARPDHNRSQPVQNNRPPAVEPKPKPITTEAEARQAENTTQLERSLAAIAEIERRAKSYCDLDPAAGFQFDPSPRH